MYELSTKKPFIELNNLLFDILGIFQSNTTSIDQTENLVSSLKRTDFVMKELSVVVPKS